MDADALVAPAEKATRAGIPLVIVDSGLHYDKIVSFVATDNKKAGALAGEELASELGDKGNVILLRFMPGSESTYDREDGFLETIAKYPNIKILSSNIYAGDTIDKALDKSLNLLNSFKGQIDGIFTPNEPTTTGMLLALKNMGLAGQLKFVGFDGGDTNMKGLRDGEINALVLQNPYKMGYTGVQVMLDHLAGKPVPPRVDTGTMLVTLANINTPPVQDLLSHTVQQ
jgi:ribose transport system substrate-binding protein